MLRLTTVDGARVEIPPCAINAIFQAPGASGCALAYDYGAGARFDTFTDAYGIVKKAVVDCGGIMNPLQARFLDPVEGQEGLHIGHVFVSRDAIVARREVLGSELGIKTILTLQMPSGLTELRLADTIDELDGIEPSPAEVPADPPAEPEAESA